VPRTGQFPYWRVSIRSTKSVGRLVRDRAVARALRHHVDLAGGEGDRRLIRELDPERAVQAQEQLVLVVGVEGERAFEARHAQDRVVHGGEVPRDVRAGQRGDDLGDRDRVHGASFGSRCSRYSQVQRFARG